MGDKIASKFGLSKLNAACLSKSAEFVTALVDDSSQGRNEADGDGWTAVHFACHNKKDGAAILKLLIDRGFSLKAVTNTGSSPLHEACRNGISDAVQLILVHLVENPPDLLSALELKDRDENTSLHLACRGGHKDVVSALLKYGYDKLVDSDAHRHSVQCQANSTGSTPIGLAIAGDHLETARLLLDSLPPGNPATSLKDFSTLFPHDRSIESLHGTEYEPMNVFFLGDAGSGKSTFIKTLQAHSQSTLSALYTLLPYVSHPADTHKVGIVPTTIEYPRRNHKCPIIFHDVTGHRNYAHEALFKCAENPLESLYLITVDVRVSEEAVKAKILYWLNFLAYSLSHHIAKRSPVKESYARIRVMVIGTFNDQMPRFSRPQIALMALCRTISDKLLSRFDWKGCYALNTRRAYSWKMIQLRSVLQEQCQRIHLSDDRPCERVSPQSYLLASIVSKHFEEASTTVMSFEKAVECVKSSNSISCKLLRNSDGGVDKVALMGLCQSLKHFSKFSIFETTHSSPNLHKRFIISNLHRLLSYINETLEGLPRHSNGIVSHSDLQIAFEQFNFPSGFVIEFMESFQICEGVTSDGLRRMRRKIRTSRRRLNSNSSFRSLRLPFKQSPCETPPPPHPPFKQSSCETPPPPRTKQQHHRRTTSYPEKFDVSMLHHPTLTVTRPSPMPMGSLRSISLSENPEDGASPRRSISGSSLTRHHSGSHRRRNPRQKDVPYCFFPTLVPAQPPDKWERDYEKYTYGFAWSLAPEKEQCFPPHFVTVLLFRLLHAFAPFATGHTQQHEKACDLWNCGISWQDKGTRACVAVHDNRAITLSMQCVQDEELQCLQLRNQVMLEIVNQKNELHPEIHMVEVFIPDDQKTDFPIYNPADVPACFDKMEIGSTITRRESVLNCTKRKSHVKLNHLLFLEPLSLLSASLLQQLLNEDEQDEKMSDEFCLELAKEIRDKWQLLAQYFQLHPSYIADVERGNQADNLSPYWAAHEVILHLRDSVGQGNGVHTYRDLRESLLDISIFSEGELNDLAKVELLDTEDSDNGLDTDY